MNTVTSVTSKNIQYEIGDTKARKEKLNIADLPTSLSAFSNDVGFIDKTVNNLINYYKKSEVYKKSEIDQKLATKWDSKFVDKLPTEDISTSTIYFVPKPKTEQEQSDSYNEYIYDGAWELIGNTYVDLSDYYRKSEAESITDSKIGVESQARELADSILQNNINSVQTNVDNVSDELSFETTERQQLDVRLTEKTDIINVSLSDETSRAINAENILSERCDTYDTHIANVKNPHSVTAEQVGLGNVTNVATTNTITLNSEENITSGAVYTGLNNKVDKVSGKGLSDQNFTYAEKTKLASLKNYDDTSIKSRISANESAITTLNGDSSTSGSVDKKIADAIAGVTQIDFTVVTELPSTGIKGTIYFVLDSTVDEKNIYKEYIWINNSWELLGQVISKVDLSDYYKKSEVNALVSVKNNKITITDDSTTLSDTDSFIEGSTETNPTSLKRHLLSSLWNYIEGKVSQKYSLEFKSLQQINDVCKPETALVVGTSSVLGSTTVEVFNAIKAYCNANKVNGHAYLSGLEIGDEGYTKYTSTSGNYESQFSVEIEYTYANSRGYAHIIPKLKNQATYTMYMNSDNTSLDGVWQKDTDKVLTERYTGNAYIQVGKDTDATGERSVIKTKFGDTTEWSLMSLYRPDTTYSQNNLYVSAGKNTVIGSGSLGSSAWNSNKATKNSSSLFLTGQDGIELSTGNSDYSKATKSTLDKSGNLTIANNITANGKVISTGDATANGATLVQNMYTKNCTYIYDSTKPYSLLAYKEMPVTSWDNEDTKFHFHLITLQYWLDCDLRLFFRWSPETTATDLSTKYCNIFNITTNKNFPNIENAFICRYTFTPKTDSANGSLKVWLYFDDSIYNASGWTNYFSKELYGKEEHYLFKVNNVLHSDARTWTYYRGVTNVAEMEGENTITTTWANLDKTNVLNANTIGVNKLEVNNSTILSFGNGNKLQANSDGSVGFTTTTGTYNLINSSGEFTCLTKTDASSTYLGINAQAVSATSASITKTTDTTNGDKLQIGSGTAQNITNAKNSSSASNTTGYCKTNADVQNKEIYIANWTTGTTGQFLINFATSNTYQGQINASINGATAVPIYIDGAISSSSNYTLNAGTYLVNYDGSKMSINPSVNSSSSIIGFSLSGTNLTLKVV